jgi:protein-S-isoprenylcysteine O-methyltransferase Ste14
MYLAVVAVILGQALLCRLVLVVYAAVVGALMWAFATWYEEPALASKFGQSRAVPQRCRAGGRGCALDRCRSAVRG